jgi:cation diffusion facilitator family transporter
MRRTNTNSLRRNQSIRYVKNEDERPVLTFGSLDKGDVEEDEEEGYHKSNIFTYNSKEDIYKLKTLKSSNNNNSNNNIDVIKEEEQIEDFNYKLYSDIEKADNEKEKIHGGNIIFANLINIDFKQKKLTPLYIIVFCYLVFSIVEIICGYYASSITLMADAAHYFSECSCFAIYIVSIYVSRKNPTNNMSFGFHRGEMIGVLVRATFLFGFSFWLLYYVSRDFLNPKTVNGLVIIILGIISTFFNLIMGLVLMFVGISNGITFSGKEITCNHQHENNGLNCYSIQRTFTNVIIKSIQSCVIILAGVLVYFLPTIKYIDPICTLLLTGILLYDAYNHMEGVITVLMEGSPLEFDVEELEENLRSLGGVIDVHDIHVWSLSIGKISMSCHLITNEPQKSLVLARDFIKKKYGITHTTIQVELNTDDNKKKCKASFH